MAFARLFKSKKPRELSIFMEFDTPEFWTKYHLCEAKEVELLPLEFAQSRPDIVYRSIDKRMSIFEEVYIKEGESAPCESWCDEDNNLSVASENTTTAAAPGLIPTTDSWLCYEYPSTYYKGIPEEEEEFSPMSSTETLVEAVAQEVGPKKVNTLRQATLIPLYIAQHRGDIKYHPEGFELNEEVEVVESKRKVWWKQY